MATKQSLSALALLAAASILLLPSASAVTKVEYCNKGKNYPVKVSGVEILPYPIERGVPTTFKISASTDKTITSGKLVINVNAMPFHVLPCADKTITSGKLVINVKYWIVNVHSETDDICTKTSCPATAQFDLAHSQTLPSITPPGSYTVQMKMLGENDEELSCISFGFSIHFFAPFALSSI